MIGREQLQLVDLEWSSADGCRGWRLRYRRGLSFSLFLCPISPLASPLQTGVFFFFLKAKRNMLGLMNFRV